GPSVHDPAAWIAASVDIRLLSFVEPPIWPARRSSHGSNEALSSVLDDGAIPHDGLDRMHAADRRPAPDSRHRLFWMMPGPCLRRTLEGRQPQRSEKMATTGSKPRSAGGSRRATPHDGDAPEAVAHFTTAERAARGKAARAELPRSAHAGWEPAPNRPDPVGLLEEQARTRLPGLIPIRYGRMLVSPFTFFRGGAYVMAAGLAHGPRTG